MPILANEIKFFLSGGQNNSDPNGSLGSAISTTEISNVSNNLFDDVSGDEANDGRTEYRAFYVKNTNQTLTLINAKVWILSNTPANDDIAIGVESSKGSPKQSIANEITAPIGIVFSSPSTKGTGVSIGSLLSNDVYMIWVRRTVPQNTGAYNDNTFTLKIEGDSRA